MSRSGVVSQAQTNDPNFPTFRSRETSFTFMSVIACLTVVALSVASPAATRCVNPGGTGGCFSTITAAVAAAHPGDAIRGESGNLR